MDTTKIFIDIDDEITFIAERIFNSPTDRIILVVPERAALTSSIISLKILKKYLDKYHQQLVLVTLDENGKKLASRVGFITRSRVGEVNDETWNEVDEKEKERTIEKQEVNEEIDTISPEDEIPDELEPQPIENSKQEETIADFESITPNTEPPETTLDTTQNDTDVDEYQEKPPEVEHKEPVNTEPTYIQSTRYVSRSKKVNLDGFDMLIGGDIIAEQTAKNLEEEKVSNTTEAIAEVSKSDSLVGKDVTAYIRKKENAVKKSLSIFNPKRLFTNSKRVILVIGIAAVILIICLVVITYIFVPSADIKIVTESKTVNITKSYTADPNVSSVNIATAELPSQFFEVTESASSSIQTTGSTTIGDKAKGNVTVYNYGTTQLTIKAGTIITTSLNNNSYQFSIDTDTTVPKEGTPGVSATAGSQNTTVTAVSIGQQYNLAANNVFSVASYSTGQLQAINTVFTGGDSKTVQTVSASDQSNLLKQIQQELFQKGQSDLTAKITKGEYLITQSVNNSIVVKNFDNNIGAQSSVLNLTLTTKTSGLAIKEDDLTTVSKDTVESQANGLVLESSSYNIIGNPSIDSSGNISLQVNTKGTLGASINKSSVINNISGKSPTVAAKYIQTLHGVKTATVTISPTWLFGFFKHLPFTGGKIHINVLSQGTS